MRLAFDTGATETMINVAPLTAIGYVVRLDFREGNVSFA